MASIYALLEGFPGAKQVADANLTHLKSVLCGASKGRYGRDKAIEIREAAKASIGSVMPAKSLELRHTIRLIHELDAEIDEIEAEIQQIMDELHSPITTIPGIGTRMGAMILAEVGDFSRFDSPERYWPTPGYHRLHTNPDSLPTAILTWKNAAHGISGTPFLMQRSMSVFGIRALPHTLLRSVPRESIIMSPYPTPPRSWCVSSTPWRNPGELTKLLNRFTYCPLRAPFATLL